MSDDPAVNSRPADAKRFFGLRSQMLLGFCLPLAATVVLMGLVVTFGIPFTSYEGTYDRQRGRVLGDMSLIADLKKDRFELWLGERKDDVRTLCEEASLLTAVGKLRDSIARNATAAETSIAPDDHIRKGPDYQALLQKLTAVTTAHRALQKIEVADAVTGVILVSTDRGEAGLRVSDRKFFRSALDNGYDESVEVEKDPTTGKIYLIVSRIARGLVLDRDGTRPALAVVSVYTDTEEFLKPMLYAGSTLGEKGEIVLVDHHGTILMSLKHLLPDGSKAKVLEYQLKAKPAMLAIRGKEGLAATEDYRGVPILAAYRYLRVSPDTGWGMVVKRDQAEVFAPLWRQVLYICLVSLFGLLAAMGLSVFLANRISRPIRNLCATALEVKAGNLDARAPAGGSDEVGILAATLNSMIDRVQHWHRDLEEQVRARTAQLNRANEELTAEVVQRTRAEKSLIKANRALKTLSHSNQAAIRAESESALMTEMCRGIVEIGGYSLAWVGFAEQDAAKTVRPVTKYGTDSGSLDKMKFSWADDDSGRGPTGTCIRTQAPCVIHDVANDSNDISWRQEAGKLGYRAALALPLMENGTCFGALNIYAAQADAFDDEEVELLQELAADLSFGLTAIRTKQQVLELKEFYETILENINDGIWVSDEKDVIFYVNSAMAKIAGAGKNRIVGPLGDFPESTPAQLHGSYLRAKESLIPVYYDSLRFVTPLGRESFQSGWLIPVVRQGRFAGMICTAQDITGHKRSEEAQKRLATAVEQAAETIVITDTEGTILYVNPASERSSGYAREEIIGTRTKDFMSSEQVGDFGADMWDTLAGGKVWSGRFVSKKKDGSLFHEEATISPVRDSSDNTINFVAVKRDITEHLKLAAQLQQAQKMEAIGTLAGGIAHDFNNLLTIILGFSEVLLAERQGNEPDYDDLKKILHAGKNGAELVQRLLTFSRKVEPKLVPLDLNRQIRQVERLLRRTISKMIEIRLDLADDLEEINADPSQMEQILMNLAVNARDAMLEAGTLTLRTENVVLDEEYCKYHHGTRPGQYVLLTVSDTGHGMDGETVEHIFEPFYTTKELGRGTGLGLAMVYGIVNQHHGYVTCYSEVGRGTAFRIYLPAVERRGEDKPEKTEMAPAFGTETILLVDDEESIRELGVRILGKAGYTVLTARNGNEALDMFQRERQSISLVIMDLMMPGMGGKECLKNLLQIDPRARILVASGYSGDASTREMVELGACGFVGKPFRMNDLLQQVRQALDNPASHSKE
ncbi:MAG: PAS domain S-box protein [Desulfomonile tiedjei]|nr:PAS domain S-box protein [Desulfomonile tiedjei]